MGLLCKRHDSSADPHLKNPLEFNSNALDLFSFVPQRFVGFTNLAPHFTHDRESLESGARHFGHS